MRSVGLFAALALIIAWSGDLFAQESTPEFHKLRTPESPAFTILGISPAQVHRPTSPATFAFAFLKDFANSSDEDGPGGFALETTPYWWKHHPDLTLEEYERTATRNLYRNLSLSMAVSDGQEEGTQSARLIGAGLRSSIVPGKAVSKQCINEVREAAAAASQRMGAVIAARIKEDPSLLEDDKRLEELNQELFSREQPAIEEATQLCMEELSVPQGFALDMAAASVFHFQDGEFDKAAVSRKSLWITPAFLGRYQSWTGVLRFIWDDDPNSGNQDAYDLGVRSIYARDRFAGSIEALWRREHVGGESENLYRAVGVFEFEILEGTWLSLSLGRDYEGDRPNSLVALANVQWNIIHRSINTGLELPTLGSEP